MMRRESMACFSWQWRTIIAEPKRLDADTGHRIGLTYRLPWREENSMRALNYRIALFIVNAVGLTPFAPAQPALPKTIKIVVPFSPGGSNDVIARAMAGPLAK